MATKTKPEYTEIRAEQLPAKVYWTTPARSGGQIVIVSYGSTKKHAGGYDDGDEFMRRHDRSDRTTTYFRLAK